MNSNLNCTIENSPVSQDQQVFADVDICEPPFERWIRISDVLLSKTSGPSAKMPPKPQKFPGARRG